MITDIILNIIYLVLYGLAQITILNLPDVTANSTVVNAITTATSYLAFFNNFLPMTTILTVLVAIIAVEAGIAIYKILMWTLRRIPTQS